MGCRMGRIDVRSWHNLIRCENPWVEVVVEIWMDYVGCGNTWASGLHIFNRTDEVEQGSANKTSMLKEVDVQCSSCVNLTDVLSAPLQIDSKYQQSSCQLAITTLNPHF